MKNKSSILWTYIAAGVVVFASLLPFLWFVATSFKTQVEITAIPPKVIPSGSLQFYVSALTRYDLLHFVKNSVIVAGSVLTGCHAVYRQRPAPVIDLHQVDAK